MTTHSNGRVRALALVGPTGGGKTTLMEAMLLAAGAVERRPGGEKLGDTSPEARARGHSVELNFAGFSFMDDRYAVIDCPGAVELAAESDAALPAVDLALIIAEPDPAKAILLQPVIRELGASGCATRPVRQQARSGPRSTRCPAGRPGPGQRHAAGRPPVAGVRR